MRDDAREDIEDLNTNNTWLFDHMIVAFYHAFGIGNGLSIQKDDVEEIRYKEGPRGYRVKASVMREKLKEYLTWLERYQATWDTKCHRDLDPQTIADIRARLFSPENGWGDVTHMIELLQI